MSAVAKFEDTQSNNANEECICIVSNFEFERIHFPLTQENMTGKVINDYFKRIKWYKIGIVQ